MKRLFFIFMLFISMALVNDVHCMQSDGQGPQLVGRCSVLARSKKDFRRREAEVNGLSQQLEEIRRDKERLIAEMQAGVRQSPRPGMLNESALRKKYEVLCRLDEELLRTYVHVEQTVPGRIARAQAELDREWDEVLVPEINAINALTFESRLGA